MGNIEINNQNSPKYKLTEVFAMEDSVKVYQIQALRDFSDVKAGDIGGWVESENNLSHQGNCWIYDDVSVLGNAKVLDNAKIYDNSFISGNVTISDNVHIFGYVRLTGNIKLLGGMEISNKSKSFGKYIDAYDYTEISNNIE